MYYRGVSGGFSFWRHDVMTDQNTWTLKLGFGGRANPLPRKGYSDPLYRIEIGIEWRPLRTCFEWWVEYLGTEIQWHHRKGVHTRIPCGVIYQYRIHSFRRWPIAVAARVG